MFIGYSQAPCVLYKLGLWRGIMTWKYGVESGVNFWVTSINFCFLAELHIGTLFFWTLVYIFISHDIIMFFIYNFNIFSMHCFLINELYDIGIRSYETQIKLYISLEGSMSKYMYTQILSMFINYIANNHLLYNHGWGVGWGYHY